MYCSAASVPPVRLDDHEQSYLWTEGTGVEQLSTFEGAFPGKACTEE